MLPKRIYAEINLDAICRNVNETKKKVGKDVDVLAIIKADAYGHGALRVARALTEIDINNFGVATAEEAIQLRKHGIDGNILLLDYAFEESYGELIENNITSTVFEYNHAKKLNDIAGILGKKADIHIKLDTGMGRIGFIPSDESFEKIKKIYELENITVSGIYTHFACADMTDKAMTYRQIEMFDNFCEKLENGGVSIPVKHLCNSAGIMEFSSAYANMVRNGIITYGLYPSDEVDKNNIQLSPAMSIKSHVVYVKEVDENFTVSYGATYVTKGKTKIATIPIGYADGYPRSLSNKGRVLINGKSAPIIGRVCMDQMMVDVTDIDDVKQGDVVTIIGKDGNETITVEELSAMSGSFNYEFVCNVNKRVPRVYIKNGKVSEIVDLIK
ncbi:MAG: alanine racemase [Ruminococcaceae bacterium]|nr:alanine racemase [Oscillospiraceae bacterium]